MQSAHMNRMLVKNSKIQDHQKHVEVPGSPALPLSSQPLCPSPLPPSRRLLTPRNVPLQELRVQNKHKTDEKEREEEGMKTESRQLGQVLLAIRNLYLRCVATQRVGGPAVRAPPTTGSQVLEAPRAAGSARRPAPQVPESGSAGEKMKQMDAYLRAVCERILDLKDIQEGFREWEKRQQDEALKLQVVSTALPLPPSPLRPVPSTPTSGPPWPDLACVLALCGGQEGSRRSGGNAQAGPVGSGSVAAGFSLAEDSEEGRCSRDSAPALPETRPATRGQRRPAPATSVSRGAHHVQQERQATTPRVTATGGADQ